MIISSSTHFPAYKKFNSLLAELCSIADINHIFLYLFIDCWVTGWFPDLGSCEECYYNFECAGLSLLYVGLQSFRYLTSSGILGHQVALFVMNLHIDLLNECSYLHCHQQCMGFLLTQSYRNVFVVYFWWLLFWLVSDRN
jgi:hypothetical protein